MSHNEALDSLRNLVKKGYRDQFNLVALSGYADQASIMRHNAKRHNAQVDARLKCLFPDTYEPPESDGDDMATIISGNVITDTDVLQQLIKSGEHPPEDEDPPIAQPVKVEIPQPLKVDTGSKPRPSILKRAAVAAGLVMTGGALALGGIALNDYLNPTPEVDPSIYDARALPYVP
jgi:hypothetical protein